jgi:hypothetical protein
MTMTCWEKIGAIAGILFPVLQMTAQGLIQVGGAEPPFTASAPEILGFFQNRNDALFAVGDYISVISLVVFLWFLSALWVKLRNIEGDPGMLSTIALASGLITSAAFLGGGGWSLAMFRIGEGLDPQTARLLFDQGNLNFANAWISLGSLALASGILFRRAASFPGWLSWGSIALAVGLFLARVVWTSQIAFLPYILFWLWMIVLGVRWLRRPGEAGLPSKLSSEAITGR